LKSPDEAQHVARRFTTLTVREGYWAGTRIQFMPGETGHLLNASMPSQVVLRLDSREEPISLLPSELTPERLANYTKSSQVRVLGDPTEREQAISRLKECGVKFEGEPSLIESPPPLEGEDLLLEIDTVFDATLGRTIFKIAFNFLAFLAGADHVLSSRYDDVRSYVRSGTPDLTRWVEFEQSPAFVNADGSSGGEGHVLSLHRQSEIDLLVAQVCTFNRNTYRLPLTLSGDDLPSDLPIAYFFDLQSRIASRV
jgi:hypothetical protein